MRILIPVVLCMSLSAQTGAQLVDSRKVWDSAAHNAFTDLVRFEGRWYLAFREGSAHVSPDGQIRILRSKDGTAWESTALLSLPGDDLRDPKLSEGPDGKLWVIAAAARPSGHQTMAWTSSDGKAFGKATTVADLNYWLWRITWKERMAYGIGYRTLANQRGARLYRWDGQKFGTHVDDLKIEGYPNESAIRFGDDGTAWCLLRRDPANALWGTAKSPYTAWTWKDMGARIGGPNFLLLPRGRVVGVVRLYDGKQRTSVVGIDPAAGTLKELVALPSSGDSSYAGLEWHRDQLWVSYYSSHEGKSSIYLARVRVE